MKRAFFLAAIAAAIAGNVASSPNQRPVPHQPSTKEQGLPCATTVIENQESSSPTDAAKHKSPYWYLSPEWMLIFVGIITCVVIGWQSWETHEATRQQREKERARLFVAVSYQNGCVDFDDPSPVEGLSTLGVEITQHGPSKAFNVRGFAMIK